MEKIDHIKKLADGIAQSMNLEIVDVQLIIAGPAKNLIRVYIYKKSGVMIEDCAKLSRELDVLLEAENILEAYTLEVSSPGLDKPLKTARDFERNIGQYLDIDFSDENEKKQFVNGKLTELKNDTLVLEIKSGKRELRMDTIEKAMIDVRI